MITVCTQVYNTKPYLAQCIDSVLAQTYTNFEYLLIDNGCTDGSEKIIEAYAEKDERIKRFRFETNQYAVLYQLLNQHARGAYYTVLDSDDWLDPDYLEKLVDLAEENDLDITCTGTAFHVAGSGQEGYRKVERTLIVPKEDFTRFFDDYHAFFRTSWGKLIRMECYKNASFDSLPKLSYGGDTLRSFQLLRQAKRIGIDDSAPHHYRIHKSSRSYQYKSDRFEADVYLYDDAIDFLSAFGPVSPYNHQFLQVVYANAVADTAGVIRDSALAPADKLREYRVIALHPLTQATYRECEHEEVTNSRYLLAWASLDAGRALKKRDGDEDLRAVMEAIFPRGGRVVSGSNAQLFLEDRELFDALARDDMDGMLKNLLARMETNQGVRKYAIPEIIRALAEDKPLLRGIGDAVFLRKYAQIYELVWRGEALAALEEMTGLLLEDRADGGQETFLRLYVSLSAALEQAPAFVFGKLKLAQLCFRQKRLPECRAVVTELEEMGLTDSEELNALRRDLEAAGL